MIDKVLGNRTENVGVSDDSFHLGDSLLTFLNLILVCALLFALGIILLDFFDLIVVKHNSCRTSVIDKIDRNAVTYCFGHCISVNNAAEHFKRSVNRRTGKPYIGGVGERVVQIFCKAVFSFYTYFRHSNLLVEIDLASVRFIGNTYYIGSVRKKLQILGEFLYCRQVNAAAFSALQFFTQLFTRLYAYNSLVTDILFRADKKLGKLIIKVGSVRDKQYSGRGKEFAFHQLTGQKEHSVALTAAGSTEVCTAFSVAGRTHMCLDIFKQLVCGKELRIAAYYF